jgi:hypothetical protein
MKVVRDDREAKTGPLRLAGEFDEVSRRVFFG